VKKEETYFEGKEGIGISHDGSLFGAFGLRKK
jgi:hypothetical protein